MATDHLPSSFFVWLLSDVMTSGIEMCKDASHILYGTRSIRHKMHPIPIWLHFDSEVCPEPAHCNVWWSVLSSSNFVAWYRKRGISALHLTCLVRYVSDTSLNLEAALYTWHRQNSRLVPHSMQPCWLQNTTLQRMRNLQSAMFLSTEV